MYYTSPCLLPIPIHRPIHLQQIVNQAWLPELHHQQGQQIYLTSWIWNHGTKINGSPGQPDRWCCNLCPQTHPMTYSIRTTSNAAEHLKLKHGMTSSGKVPSSQCTIKSCKPNVDSNTFLKHIPQTHRWMDCRSSPCFPDSRNQLKTSIVGAIECLHRWLGERFIKDICLADDDISEGLKEETTGEFLWSEITWWILWT